jgi:hypothetical protein
MTYMASISSSTVNAHPDPTILVDAQKIYEVQRRYLSLAWVPSVESTSPASHLGSDDFEPPSFLKSSIIKTLQGRAASLLRAPLVGRSEYDPLVVGMRSVPDAASGLRSTPLPILDASFSLSAKFITDAMFLPTHVEITAGAKLPGLGKTAFSHMLKLSF